MSGLAAADEWIGMNASLGEREAVVADEYSLAFRLFLSILMGALCLETVAGNILVLLASYTDVRLRQPSNALIASLAVSDLLIGVEGYPVLTSYVLNGGWTHGSLACDLWLSLDYALCLVSIFAVLLITADRYLSVCYAVAYRNWQTLRKTQLTIVVSWLLPLVVFAALIFGWERRPDATDCSAPFLEWPYLNMLMYISYYWLTLAAMIYMYYKIQMRVKALQRGRRSTISDSVENSSAQLSAVQKRMVQMGVGVLMSVQGRILEMHTTTNEVHRYKDSGIDSDSANARVAAPIQLDEADEQDEGRMIEEEDDEVPANLITTSATRQSMATYFTAYSDFSICDPNSFVSAYEFQDALETQKSPTNQKAPLLEQKARSSVQLSRRLSTSSSSSDESSPQRIPPPELYVNPASQTERESFSLEPSIARASHVIGRLTELVVPPMVSARMQHEQTQAVHRARKAFRTITLILGSFALLWSPYYILATIYGFSPSHVPAALFTVSYYLCYINSSLNPFCYAFANREYKGAFLRILRGDFGRR